MTTLEQYINEKVEEFSMQHFQSFYLDVINRGYTLQQYLDEDEMFNLHVEDVASHDFLELREILNISKEKALTMDHEDMAAYIKDEYRSAVEKRFIELLNDKLVEIEGDLQEDDLTDRDIRTFQDYKKELVRAIQEGKK